MAADIWTDSGDNWNTAADRSGGADEAFVFSAGFGQAAITDFAAHDVGPNNDVISLASSDFADWATLLADAHSSGTGGGDTTFVSQTGDATLTIAGASLAAFQQTGSPLQADFKFACRPIRGRKPAVLQSSPLRRDARHSARAQA
ncbi:MAG: hypothetical protein ABR878_15610 [Roseiarcus sp.]|jgi:hypothetical protein